MTERKEEAQIAEEQQKLIDRWKQQFETDRREKKPIDSLFDEYEQYYQGKRSFGNTSDNAQRERGVRTVVNFVRTPIEALIDLSVPQPDIAAVALDDEYAVKLMNKYIDYVCNSNNLEEINLENEREVKKFGGCFYKVHWNNAVKNGSYVGDIEISNPHPKHIVPNAGATSIEDMEHYHHIVNATEKYILRRFPHVTKEDLEDKATLYKEYDELADDNRSYSDSSASNTAESGLKRYSIIETTYRDDDGDICKIWWSGDLLLDKVDKFYWHRDENGEPTNVEVLEPGTQIRVGMDAQTNEPIYRTVEPQVDEEGNVILDEETGMPIGEEVEYYIPKGWDLIYQPYLPKDMSFWGTSLIDDIKDLYEAALKAVYIQEESFLRGRKKIATDNENDAKKIMEAGTEVITLTGTVREIDLNTNIDGINWIEWLWGKIQLITGATNAAMGVHDPGVKSGKQAQLYVSQANFKANLASTYKAIAYKKLYRCVADFAMAFCDDDRPFRLTGEKDKPEYGTFSRLSMLRDDNGNVIYPNWDINVSCQAGFMQNKSEIFQQIVMLANNRSFDPTPGNVMYLKVLQKLGVPFLESILADMEQEIKKQEELQQQQMQMQQMQQQGQGQPQGQGGGQQLDVNQVINRLPPEQQAQFAQLSPEQQQAMLGQLMGGV